MRKLVALAAGLAVLCGMTVFAQPKPGAHFGNPGPGGGGPQGGPAALGDPIEEHIAQAHHMAGLLVRAVREGQHDPATWPLVSKALTDRTAMLQAELTRVSKVQALLTAMQGGDKDAIQTARQDLKTATEAVAAAAKTFIEDAAAVHEHLKSERGAKQDAAGTGTAAPPAPLTAR